MKKKHRKLGNNRKVTRSRKLQVISLKDKDGNPTRFKKFIKHTD